MSRERRVGWVCEREREREREKRGLTFEGERKELESWRKIERERETKEIGLRK